MKKYLVSLECHTIHQEEVEAKNKEEAKEIAIEQGRGNCFGDAMTVYEIEEIKEGI